MAAKKSKDRVEDAGTPAQGEDGGITVQQYFAEQDQVEGTRRNPKKTAPPKGGEDLITAVEACVLINGITRALTFDPAALYRDCGNTAPAAHELSPGEIRFSRDECGKFAKAWVAKREARARLKAEEATAAKEMAQFYAEPSPVDPKRDQFNLPDNAGPETDYAA